MKFHCLPVLSLILLVTNMASSCPPAIVPVAALVMKIASVPLVKFIGSSVAGGLIGVGLDRAIPQAKSRKMLFDKNTTNYAAEEVLVAEMEESFNSFVDNIENVISLKMEIENLTMALGKNMTNYVANEVSNIVSAEIEDLWNSVSHTINNLMSLGMKIRNSSMPLSQNETFYAAKEASGIVVAGIEKISNSINHTIENLKSLKLKIGKNETQFQPDHP